MDSDFLIQLIARLDPTKAAEDLREIEKQLNAKSGGVKIKTVIDTAASKQEIQNYAIQIQKLLKDVGVDIDVSKIISSLNQVGREAENVANKVKSIQGSLNNGTYDVKIAALEAQFKKLGLTQDEVATKMKAVKAAYTELSSGGLGQEELIQKEKQFNNELTTTSNQLKILKLEMGEYVSTTKQINLSNRIQKWLDNNTRATKEARAELTSYVRELQSGQVTNARFNEMNTNFGTLDTKMRSIGRLGKSFFDTLSSGMKKFSYWTSSTFLIMKGIQEIRKAVNFAKELDSALTNINYTMDVTQSELKQIGNESISMAKDLKTSAENVLGAVKLYANAKETADTILQKAQPAIMLANVSGFTGEQSAKYLQTIMNQFDLTQDDLMGISDTIQSVSQNLAHDFSDGIVQINESIETSGEVARAAGLDLAEYSSMVGLLIEKTGLAGSRIGNSLKTIITRTTKASKVVDIDEGEISDAEKALKNVGVAVRATDGEFREFDDTMKDLASVWDTLTDVEKSNVSFALAGTRQINVIQSLLRNWSEYEDLVVKANDSAGVTFENQEKYAESLEGKMKGLSATMTSAWKNLISNDELTPTIDGLTKLAKGIELLTDKAGLLGTIGLGAGLFTGIKNVGIFRTITNDVTGANKSIGLFGLSLQNLKTRLNGIRSNGFFNTSLIDANAINSYNTAIKNGASAEFALAQASKGANAETIALMRSANGATVSTESLTAAQKASTVAARLQSAAYKAVSIAGNMIVMWGISKAISTIYSLTQEAAELKELAGKLGSELSSTASDIEDYKQKIDDLNNIIHDSTSSYEEVRQARVDLMQIQDELIGKFGTEKESIENITEAINGQSDALDNLSKEAYYKAKNEYDKWTFGDRVDNFQNKASGAIKAAIDGLTSWFDSGKHYEILNPVAMKKYFDYEEPESVDYTHSDELHLKMLYGDDYNLRTTGNNELDQMISKAYGLIIDDSGEYFYGLDGTLEEIQNKLAGIQAIASDYNVSPEFTDSFTKISTDVDDTLEKYKDFDRQYTLYERILSNDGISKQFDIQLNLIEEAKKKLDEAILSGNTEEIKKASNEYAETVSNAMSIAIDNNSYDVANYFKTLYPKLESIVSEWQFTVNFTPNVNGLKDNVEGALDKIDGIQDGQISFTSSDLKNFNPIVGFDIQKEGYAELKNIAEVQYGMTLESFISLLESMGVVESQLQHDIFSKYVGLVQGVSSEELKKNIQSLSPEELEAAQNVDPGDLITWDELIEKIREVKSETEEVSKISFEDAWKSLDNPEDDELKNTKNELFELAKAGELTEESFKNVDGAEKWAESIDGTIGSIIEKINNHVVSLTYSFEDAWKHLDNPDDSDLKNTKNELLELAKAGQLTEKAFKEVDGAEKWAESVNESIGSIVRQINGYVTASDQLSVMSEGISSLTENLYNKTKDKDIEFIDADTLAKMPEELKECKKEWKEYEQVMGDANSSAEDAQRVTDALATALVNNGNYLSNVTEENKGYYISQMESVGITNAKEIADKAAADNAAILANTENALTIATEAASGEINESTNKLLDYSSMSNTAKAALMDLSAKQTIFSNSSLSVQDKVDALNRLAKAYFGVGAAITYAGVMGTDPRFVKEGKSVDEQWDDFVKDMNKVDLAKLTTTGTNPDKKKSPSNKGSGSSKDKASKFFDYIEIRLKRLDRLRSNYLEKAEDGTKSLTKRTNNYNKALGVTSRQINTQNRAIKRYNKELKKIDLDEKIAKKLRKGDLSTENLKGKKKEKAEKYQELYEKRLSAIDDRDELISNRNQIKSDKIQLKIDNHENKRKHLDTLTEQLKSDFDLTSTKGNYNSINNVVSKQITNYQKQNKLIEKQQSLVKKGSEEWYKYQDSIDSNNESIQDLRQSMIDLISDGLDKALDKLEDADELSDAKIQNALTASEKNKYVDEKIKNIPARKSVYANAITDSVNAIATNKSAVLNTKVVKKDKEIFNTIKNYVNGNQLIPEDVLEKITDDELLKSCTTYNSAITAYETNKAAKELYEQTSKEDLRNLVQEKADHIVNESENKLSKIDAERTKTEAEISKNEALGVGQSKSVYQTQISQSKERQKELQNEKKSLEELLSDAIKNGQIVKDDPVFNSITNTINGIDSSISDCVFDQIKFNKSITDMNLNNYKSLLDLLDKINDKFSNFRNLFDVHNHAVDDEVIFGEIANNNNIIEANKQIIADRVKEMRKSLLNSIEKYGWGMNLTEEQTDAVLDYLLHGQTDKIQDYLSELLGVDINTESFPGLFETIDEIENALNGIYQSYVDQENLFNEYFDKRIDGINKYLDKLQKEKDIKDRTYAIEKAQFDLEKARNNLTKKVWDGNQWVYAADTDAIQSAQEAFDDAKYDELVNVAEDLISVLEYIRDNLNFYDDYGNQILPTDSKAIAELLQANGISETDDFLKNKGIDVGAMDLAQFLLNPSSIPSKTNIPELKTPKFSNSYTNNSLQIDKIELVMPNINDASTARDLAQGLLNQLSNLPSYVKQYDWNK